MYQMRTCNMKRTNNVIELEPKTKLDIHIHRLNPLLYECVNYQRT